MRIFAAVLISGEEASKIGTMKLAPIFVRLNFIKH